MSCMKWDITSDTWINIQPLLSNTQLLHAGNHVILTASCQFSDSISKDVVLKLSDSKDDTTIKREFKFLYDLQHRSSTQGFFVEAYMLLQFSDDHQIPQEFSGGYFALVLEKGMNYVNESYRESLQTKHEKMVVGNRLVQIVMAAEKRDLVMMDVKWENFVLFNNERNMSYTIRMIDLDSAMKVGDIFDGNEVFTSVTTMAPELVKVTQPRVTMGMHAWSTGVLLFELFYGKSIWMAMGVGLNENDIGEYLMQEDLQAHIIDVIDSSFPPETDYNVNVFLKDCLNVDPSHRKSMTSIANRRSFLKGEISKTNPVIVQQHTIVSLLDTISRNQSTQLNLMKDIAFGYNDFPRYWILVPAPGIFHRNQSLSDLLSKLTSVSWTTPFRYPWRLFPLCSYTFEPCGDGYNIDQPRVDLQPLANSLR